MSTPLVPHRYQDLTPFVPETNVCIRPSEVSGTRIRRLGVGPPRLSDPSLSVSVCVTGKGHVSSSLKVSNRFLHVDTCECTSPPDCRFDTRSLGFEILRFFVTQVTSHVTHQGYCALCHRNPTRPVFQVRPIRRYSGRSSKTRRLSIKSDTGLVVWYGWGLTLPPDVTSQSSFSTDWTWPGTRDSKTA